MTDISVAARSQGQLNPTALHCTNQTLRVSVSGSRCQLGCGRTLYVFVQYHPCGLPSVHVTHRVRGYAFDARVVVSVGVWLDERNHRGDLAVLRAPYIDASLEPWILLVIRLRISHVDIVFLIDVDSAGAAELLPLIEEASILIEDLDSTVPTVAHKNPAS